MWQFGKLDPFLCTGRTHSLLSFGNHSVIVRRQSQCFDAFNINVQKDANERKLIQAGRTSIAIYAPNLRYVLCT